MATETEYLTPAPEITEYVENKEKAKKTSSKTRTITLGDRGGKFQRLEIKSEEDEEIKSPSTGHVKGKRSLSGSRESIKNKDSKELIQFPQVIELNVGGTQFTTTLATLRKYSKSLLGKLFSGKTAPIKDSSGRYFIDRDPETFAVILHFLRTDKVVIPNGMPIHSFLEECSYYDIDGFEVALTVNTNVAEQFRFISYKAIRPSFEKLWPVLQKRLKIILENEPAYVAEIEWGPRGGFHNSVHKVEANYDADWVSSKVFIKVDIAWKEGGLRPNACVESWGKFLMEYGFRTQIVDDTKLRFYW